MFKSHPGIEVDVFAHIWNFNSHQGSDELLDYRELEDFANTTKPVSLMIDAAEVNPRSIMERERARIGSEDWSAILWQASQFYSIMRAANLKRQHEIQHGFEYDVCVRGRADLVFTRETPAELARFPIPVQNTIYTVHSYFDEQFKRDRIGDLFFYSDSLVFDRVCDFFRHGNSYTVFQYTFEGSMAPPEIPFRDFIIDQLRLDEVRLKAEPQLKRPDGYRGPLGRHETR